MKPNFALNLSSDSVQVLQRASTGWHLLGTTRFDVPDLDAAMARLRDRASEAAPEGIRAKLVIPESELRYVTVPAPGPTDEARRHQIEAEIEGLTPYAIDELVYDYVVEGDAALVVICARETLGEAEGFARAHDFNPVSFVAMPQPGHFPGEPFFGEVRGAGKVTRDIEPIRVTPRPATPARAPVTPAATAPATPAKAEAKPALDPAVTAAGMPPAGPAGRVAAAAQAAAPEALSRVGDLVRRMGTRLRREQAETPAPKATPVAQPVAPVPPPPTAPTPAPPAKAPAPVPPKPPSDEKPVEKPAAAAKAPEAPPAKPVEAPAEKAAQKPADKPAEDSPAIAFASRRRPVGNEPKAAAPAPATKGPALVASGSGSPADAPRPGGRLAVLPPSDAAPRAGLMARLLGRGKARAKPAEKAKDQPAPKPAAAPIAAPAVATTPTVAKPGEPALKPLTPVAAAEAPAAPLPGSRLPASDRARNSEAEALTIFGARNRPSQDSSFARRGLMLTGGLLLLLVAVAIWAAYFTTTPQQSADGTAAPGEALPAIEAPARLSAPEILPDAPSDAIIPRDTATAEAPATEEPTPEELATEVPATEELATEAPATEEGILDEPAAPVAEEAAPTTGETALTDPEQMLEELTQEALSEELPLDLLDRSADPVADSTTPAPDSAAEGTATPQTPQLGEESGFASAERLSLPRPLELPQREEVPLFSPAPPLPFGTQVTLGADGLVEATPDGALTPQGVIVTAGRPSEVPPARPAGLAPEAPATEAPAEAPAEEASAPAPEASVAAAEEPATETATETDAETGADNAEALLQPVAIVVADDTPQADPALAGFRPEPRSERVAALGASGASDAEPPAEASAEATADPAPPDAEATEATEADADAAPGEDASALPPAPGGVSLAALRPQQRPTDLVEPGVAATIAEGGTPEAVATSLVPSARPEDLSTRIREALAEARQQPQAAAPAQQTAAAAPGPQIPTSASVAERATQTRAINLRRINLVGVFGTPSDRRALVRLSDGRVVRVQVGDSLDGGRVSAIGDDELRYVKNGRNEILRIGQRS